MTPERWQEIKMEPAISTWFCSDWIKNIVRDLIVEVTRLRETQAALDQLQKENERLKLENAEIQRREDSRLVGNNDCVQGSGG